MSERFYDLTLSNISIVAEHLSLDNIGEPLDDIRFILE
jgi:hypothetical protein